MRVKKIEEPRRRAREQSKSLNEVPVKRRNLEDIAGSWIEDPEVDEALADQRRMPSIPEM